MFNTTDLNKKHQKIVVVIPAYKVEKQIEQVLSRIPAYVNEIIVVNDCSPDALRERVLGFKDKRIHLLSHKKNQGVGGAMLSGYAYALQLGADVVVKVDGDGQMNLEYLPMLVEPILSGTADYTKGNRFLHPVALRKMPFLRKLGNLALTFLTKLASGYWNIFDPTNGYTAISGEKLQALDPERISKSYFFETSMLCELRELNAVVEDIAMPAIYQDEKSSVKISREIFVFSVNLFSRFVNRIFYRYFLYDFNAVSFFLLSGGILGLFGVVWGIAKWAQSSRAGIPATTGTVLIAVLPIILAVQFWVQALAQDIEDVPTRVEKVKISQITNGVWERYLSENHFNLVLDQGDLVIEK